MSTTNILDYFSALEDPRQILKRLERKSGATIDALINLTSWQKHSVHGALSKLRNHGFGIRLVAVSKNRTAYRLVLVEA